MSVLPSQTLYINNLNDKIQKFDLKRNLYGLFSTYGKILDIVALKTMKCRGQAFIVYSDIPSATAALRSLQGFVFLGKEMKIDYAKTTSKIIRQLTGTYQSISAPRVDPPVTIPNGAAEKRTREEEEEDSAEVNEEADSKRVHADNVEEDDYEPHRVLYIENLPSGVSDEVVAYLFKQYSGFKEVRMVPGRPDLAFVEFETSYQATTAKSILDGFKVTADHPMKITYAKK